MSLRARVTYALAQHGPTVVVALVAVGLLALGGAAWVHSNPPTTEVTDRTNTQTVGAELRTSAVVSGNTSLYEPGTRLTEEPVYLRTVAPIATLNLTTAVPDDGPVDVTHRLELVYAAARNGEEFWRRSETLARESSTTEDGTARTAVTVDVRALADRIDGYRSEIGSAGSLSTAVRYTVSYDTGRYADRLTGTSPVRITSEWYSITGDAAERTHGTPVTRTVTVPRTEERTTLAAGIGGVIAVVAGLATGVVYHRRLRPLSSGALAHRIHRRRYAEWISSGRLPDDRGGPEDTGERTVEVDTLEGLVDVAIDSGTRVVHDPERERYAVFTGAMTYRFDPERP